MDTVIPRTGCRGLLASLSTAAILIAGTGAARAEAATDTSPHQGPLVVEQTYERPVLAHRFASPVDDSLALDLWGSARISRWDGIRESLVPVAPGLFERYRTALVHESARTLRKEPYLFYVEPEEDDQDLMVLRARKRAVRIFEKTHNELLSDVVDRMVMNAGPLRAAHRYIRGIDLELGDEDPLEISREVDTDAPRIGRSRSRDLDPRAQLVVSTRPRVNLETWLPGGIRAELEVPLTSSDISASLSRRLNQHLRATVSSGVEDGGWVTTSLKIRF